MFNGLLKGIAVAVLLAGGVIYVLANQSTLTQELTCKGHWKEVGQKTEVPEIAHVQLTQYRWWVLLWSESDGNVAAQTEKLATAAYIERVRKTGDGSLTTYIFRDREYAGGEMRGGYRVANGEMTIKFTDHLVFVGVCAPRGK